MLGERFFRRFFLLAALYNIGAGTVTVLFPQLFFSLFGLPEVNHAFVMRALGMFVGIYGYGFYLVSTDLRLHHGFAMLGLIGKTLGVIGWAYYTVIGEIPAEAYWTNFFNDIIWIPFLLLYFRWLKKNSSANGNIRL